MAVYRNVNMSFWTDTKVMDEYTPEDKYFMLYALTNNYTNIIGCYEISIRQMSNDLGYNKDVVESLLKRFKEVHKTIDYDFDTKELFVVNWHKYNWNASPKLDVPLCTAIESVKSDSFHDRLATIYNQRESISEKNDTLSIPYRYGMDTTNSNRNSNSNSNSNNICVDKKDKPNDNEPPYEEIIDYVNNCAELNSHLFKKIKTFKFDHETKNTRKLIKSLWKQKYSLLDFKYVIACKYDDFIEHEKQFSNGTMSSRYYNPATLFADSNFSKYLEEARQMYDE